MKVVQFKREHNGRYTVVYRTEPVDVPVLVAKIQNPDRRLAAGRGAPGVFDMGGRAIVCRQYLHGGWLRGITGGVFFSEGRALREFEVTAYLQEKGFPVVSPVAYVVEKRPVSMRLYFLSVFLGGSCDLVAYSASAGKRQRLRMSKKLAAALFEMGRFGVYHPDLHLRNVLVKENGELVFLDFDKACRKGVGPGDYERMFWRLDRFVRKYGTLFGRPVDDMERMMFLRTYERLSGEHIIDLMKEKRPKMERSSRLGWFIDRLLYGKK